MVASENNPSNAQQKAKKNTGKPYEKLTREVFARMQPLEQAGAKVEHDVLVKGKSGLEHQIDVLITISHGPVLNKTLIQCKDWGAQVKKSDVMELHSVVMDVPGSVGGFFVARSGYQSGAKTYALHHGIKLYELREARAGDWEGFLKAVGITIKLNYPVCVHEPILDMEWTRARLLEAGVAKGTMIDLVATQVAGEFESGRPFDLDDALKAHFPPAGESRTVQLDFAPDALMLEMPGLPIPAVRCIGLKVEITMKTLSQQIEIRFDEYVKYHFLDVLTEEGHFLGEDGGPPTPR